MRASYYIWPKAITKEACERIKEEATHLPLQEAIAGSKADASGTMHPNYKVRKGGVRWFPINTPRYRWLYDYIDTFVQIANKKMFGFDMWGNSAMQYTEYNTSGTHYDWHMDTDLRDFVTMEHRKLSCGVLLDAADTYEGGEFELENYPNLHNEFKNQGDVLIFPSLLRHRVKPMIKGSRHSLITWYTGPKWR